MSILMEDDNDLIEGPVDLDDIVENNASDNEIEMNENQSDNDENKDDENKQVIKPKRKVVREKRFVLDANLLRGKKGLRKIESIFKDVKFKGKGREKEDLNKLMSYLGYWAHQLYPKYPFDDCLEKIAKLGSKKIMQTYLKKIRSGLIDSDDDENVPNIDEEQLKLADIENEIEFNRNEQNDDFFMSQQSSNSYLNIDDETKRKIQLNKELAMKKLEEIRQRNKESLEMNSSPSASGLISDSNVNEDTNHFEIDENIISSPSQISKEVNDVQSQNNSQTDATVSEISEEQKQRMLNNRKRAEEIRLARYKQLQEVKNSA